VTGCKTCFGLLQAQRELRLAACSRKEFGNVPQWQQVYSCITCRDASGAPLGLCRGYETSRFPSLVTFGSVSSATGVPSSATAITRLLIWVIRCTCATVRPAVMSWLVKPHHRRQFPPVNSSLLASRCHSLRSLGTSTIRILREDFACATGRTRRRRTPCTSVALAKTGSTLTT
jgi:hypothetical protein